MKTVHKHIIPTDASPVQLRLSQGWRLLKAEYVLVTKQVCCWVEVPTDPQRAQEHLELRLFRSGDGIPADYHYVDTAVDALAPEAWHLYSRPSRATRVAA